MKSILCPADFSYTSMNAIAYAAKLAQIFPAAITLLHVQSAYDLSPSDVVRGTHMTQDSIRQALEAQADEVTRAFKVVCRAELEESTQKLSTVIHDKGKSFDLVVMGSNGPDDLYQLAFGTNTYNSIIKSETPILVVPADCVFRSLTSIVYAFDYLRNRTLPLEQLLPLAEKLGCKVTVLQVMEESYSQEVENDLNELQYILSTYLPQELELTYDAIRDSDVPNAINSYMQQSSHDALALCVEHHNLLGRIFHKSVIQKITAVTSYPVIIFQR